MQLVKWSPMRELFDTRRGLNSLVDGFFSPSRVFGENEDLWAWNPAVDIFEEKDNIVVKAELPGVSKEGISVDVKGRLLTIKGERSSDNEVKEGDYYHRERTFGRFQRTITLPGEVDPDAIKAEYSDGVLKITVAKPEAHKPKQITVH